MPKAEDAEPDWTALLLAVRDGRDRAAFATLFRHFAPRLRAFLRKSGASASEAEECVQDVMATLWQKAALFDPARASASAWIFGITRNRRIDLWRQAARPEPEDLPWGPEAEPSGAETLALRQESAALAAALQDLPPAQRALIEKAYFGDLSHGDLAKETGLPLGTVKSRLRLALARLRHLLEGHAP